MSWLGRGCGWVDGVGPGHGSEPEERVDGPVVGGGEVGEWGGVGRPMDRVVGGGCGRGGWASAVRVIGGETSAIKHMRRPIDRKEFLFATAEYSGMVYVMCRMGLRLHSFHLDMFVLPIALMHDKD